MASRTCLCLLPPEVALSLSPSRIRLLRRSYDGLRGFDESDPLAIARAIVFRDLPERTADLFHTAVYLASNDAREAICEAARGRKDLAPWLLLTAVDLAIDVARAADAGDEAARGLQARARARDASFVAARPELELFMKHPARPARVEAIVEAGRAVHGESFVDGWVLECSDGVIRAVIAYRPRAASSPPASRPLPPSPPAAPKRPEAAPERRAGKPLRCDTIQWEPTLGRVGLALARAARMRDWREQLGIGCAGDPDFFEPRPTPHERVRVGATVPSADVEEQAEEVDERSGSFPLRDWRTERGTPRG
jgi:hypothetical protein